MLRVAVIVVRRAKKGYDGGDWINAALGAQGFVGAADSTVSLQLMRND
jgi:hypothetical protein